MIYVIMSNSNNPIYAVTGKDTAAKMAKQIDGYVVAMEVDEHLTPFALRD